MHCCSLPWVECNAIDSLLCSIWHLHTVPIHTHVHVYVLRFLGICTFCRMLHLLRILHADCTALPGNFIRKKHSTFWNCAKYVCTMWKFQLSTWVKHGEKWMADQQEPFVALSKLQRRESKWQINEKPSSLSVNHIIVLPTTMLCVHVVVALAKPSLLLKE